MKITCDKCNKDHDVRIRKKPKTGFYKLLCPWCKSVFVLEFLKNKSEQSPEL